MNITGIRIFTECMSSRLLFCIIRNGYVFVESRSRDVSLKLVRVRESSDDVCF